MSGWRLILGLMILNLLLLSTSYTIVMPFIPVYLTQELSCGGGDLSLWTGLSYGVTFVVAAVATPLWGKFADKTGRKIMLVRVSLLLCLAYLGCALARTPLEFCLARAFQGLASGMWPAVLAIITGFVPKDRVGIAMGLAQSSNLLGTVLGPAIGGFLASVFSVSFCFWLTAGMSGLVSLLNIICAREPPLRKDGPAAPDMTLRQILGLQDLRLLLPCVTVGAFAIMVLVPVIALHVAELTGGAAGSVELAGLLISASGLAGILASPLWGYLSSRVRPFRLLAAVTLASGLCYSLQFFHHSLALFGLLQFAAGLFICAISPCVNTMIAQRVDVRHCAKAYALTYVFQQGGNCLGPASAAVTLHLFATGHVFLAAGAVLLVTGLLALRKDGAAP